jgi:hypothetical protein
MTNIESSVLGQILLYPHTHTYLNKLSPLWFTEWRKDVVTTMQELYLSNQPITLSSVGMAHKAHLHAIATLTNVVSTNAYFEQEIQQLEVAYKKHNLQSKIAYIDYKKELKDIISDLTTLLVESTVSVQGQSKHIGIVAGDV